MGKNSNPLKRKENSVGKKELHKINTFSKISSTDINPGGSDDMQATVSVH
jgi:hypothetical protein